MEARWQNILSLSIAFEGLKINQPSKYFIKTNSQLAAKIKMLVLILQIAYYNEKQEEELNYRLRVSRYVNIPLLFDSPLVSFLPEARLDKNPSPKQGHKLFCVAQGRRGLAPSHPLVPRYGCACGECNLFAISLSIHCFWFLDFFVQSKFERLLFCSYLSCVFRSVFLPTVGNFLTKKQIIEYRIKFPNVDRENLGKKDCWWQW